MDNDTNSSCNASHQTSTPISDTDADRFWEKVRQVDSDCWEWTAYTDRDGYGRFSLNGNPRRAHRVAARLDGRDPTGKVVRHACDNPSCVNPAHLKVGSQHENMRDRDRSDRGPCGARNGQAKLTKQEVLAIRKTTRPSRVVAPQYSVSPSQIRAIRSGGSWSHLH